MMLEKVLNAVECVAFPDNQHISLDPVVLTCGHCICRDCVPKDNSIKCFKCDVVNKNNLNEFKQAFGIQCCIETHCEELIKYTIPKLSEAADLYKDKKANVLESLENEKNIIKNDIDIRVESLKASLDSIRDEMYHEVDVKFESLKNKVKMKTVNNMEAEIIKSVEQLDLLYSYQKNLYEIKNSLKCLSNFKADISLHISDFKIDRSIVGDILSKKFENFEEKLREKSYQEFTIDVNGTDICVLPNENIVLTSYDEHCIILYDKEFNLLKAVDSFGQQKISAFSGVTNNVDKIYFADFDLSKIFVTDLNLNIIKSQEIQGPNGLVIFNGHLFVCSFSTSRVLKFDENLENMNSYKVLKSPWQIKITEERAIVSNSSKIAIYDKDTFTKVYATLQHPGDICLFDDYFFTTSSKGFKLYDMNGRFIKLFAFVLPYNNSETQYHGLQIVDDKMFLSTRNKLIYVIKFS